MSGSKIERLLDSAGERPVRPEVDSSAGSSHEGSARRWRLRQR
jgi:hypothetical protein